MTKEQRIVFDAADIVRLRISCAKCKAESVYPLDGNWPRFEGSCPHCGSHCLNETDISVVREVFSALRSALCLLERQKLLKEGKKVEPVTLGIKFEIEDLDKQ